MAEKQHAQKSHSSFKSNQQRLGNSTAQTASATIILTVVHTGSSFQQLFRVDIRRFHMSVKWRKHQSLQSFAGCEIERCTVRQDSVKTKECLWIIGNDWIRIEKRLKYIRSFLENLMMTKTTTKKVILNIPDVSEVHFVWICFKQL